jgi:hypothetical protein
MSPSPSPSGNDIFFPVPEQVYVVFSLNFTFPTHPFCKYFTPFLCIYILPFYFPFFQNLSYFFFFICIIPLPSLIFCHIFSSTEMCGSRGGGCCLPCCPACRQLPRPPCGSAAPPAGCIRTTHSVYTTELQTCKKSG